MLEVAAPNIDDDQDEDLERGGEARRSRSRSAAGLNASSSSHDVLNSRIRARRQVSSAVFGIDSNASEMQLDADGRRDGTYCEGVMGFILALFFSIFALLFMCFSPTLRTSRRYSQGVLLGLCMRLWLDFTMMSNNSKHYQ